MNIQCDFLFSLTEGPFEIRAVALAQMKCTDAQGFGALQLCPP